MRVIRKQTLPACTDAGNAELFASLCQEHLRFDHLCKQWLIWDEHWWRGDADGEVVRIAKQAARYRFRCASTITDEALRQKHIRWALSSESWNRLKATMELAKAEKPLADTGKDWNSDPWLFGVKNGVIDLKTGEVRDGLRTDRITFHSDFAFDLRATCDQWLKFLDDVFLQDQGLIDYVQQAVGYCLTGDTREQCTFLCEGEGSNGKSTFLAVLGRVFGDYAQNLPFSAFELAARASVPNDIASIVGRRLVTAVETNESVRLNEARIKALTGEDAISARFFYREFFTFRPVAKVWLAFNHKPTVADDSYGFWRRIRLIPFPALFEGASVDKRLAKKLIGEGEGILAWAVRGCLAWQERGLGAPPQVLDATAAYQAESDPLRDFFEDCCFLHPDVQIETGLLWRSYLDWVKENTIRSPLNRKDLAKRLERAGLKPSRIGHARTRSWLGICRLIDANEFPVSADADVRTEVDVKLQ